MNTLNRFLTVMALAGLLSIGGLAGTAQAAEGDVYTLKTCPISGKELGDTPVVKSYDGREIRFCCEGCPSRFEADQAAQMAKVDEALIAEQKDSYPLTTCIVSGRSLGDSPVFKVHNNQVAAFCCNNCAGKFENEPAEILSKLDKAIIEAQLETYARTTCLVSDEDLGSMGDPVKLVVANRLVQLCCAGCKKPLEKSPLKYLSKLD